MLLFSAIMIVYGGIKLWSDRWICCSINAVTWLEDSEEVIASAYIYRPPSILVLFGEEWKYELERQDILQAGPRRERVDKFLSYDLQETMVFSPSFSLPAQALAELPQDEVLAIATRSEGISLVDRTDSSIFAKLPVDLDTSFAVSRTSKILVAETGIFSLADMSHPKQLHGYLEVPFDWSSDGTILAMFDDQGKLGEFTLGAELECIKTYHTPIPSTSSLYASLEYSANDRYLVAASARGIPNGMMVWDLKESPTKPAHIQTDFSFRMLTSHPNDEPIYFAVGEELGLVSIDVENGTVRKAKGSASAISVCVSPSGRYLATGNSKGTIQFWDAMTLQEVSRQHYSYGPTIFPVIVWTTVLVLWFVCYVRVRRGSTSGGNGWQNPFC